MISFTLIASKYNSFKLLCVWVGNNCILNFIGEAWQTKWQLKAVIIQTKSMDFFYSWIWKQARQSNDWDLS